LNRRWNRNIGLRARHEGSPGGEPLEPAAGKKGGANPETIGAGLWLAHEAAQTAVYCFMRHLRGMAGIFAGDVQADHKDGDITDVFTWLARMGGVPNRFR
jgi:hypothetical protein